MAIVFVPVTGLEQAVALREAGLLYYVSEFSHTLRQGTYLG